MTDTLSRRGAAGSDVRSKALREPAMKMDEDEDREPIAMNYYILSPDSARQRKQARLFAASPDRYSAKPLSLRGQSCQDAYLLDAQLFFTRPPSL